MYINDLPDFINCTLKLFADDALLYSTMLNQEDGIYIQDNIFNACDWVKKWQMKFNVKKCVTLHIGKNTQNIDFVMKDNTKIN